MTATGLIHVERQHGYCTHCGQPGFGADTLLGLTDRLTPRARRMATLAGVHDPFRKAQRLLVALAGWSIDAETLRRLCHKEAQAAAAGRDARQALPEQFAQSEGDWELHIDAGKVNTPEGWRDIKLAVVANRERGDAATAANYEQRDLPAPTVRSVVAAVEEAEVFGLRCLAETTRLCLPQTKDLSVLGDGAEWIWNLAGARFDGAAQVLDVYHAIEHLADAGRAALGSGADLKVWLAGARLRLVGDGYCGVCEVLAEPLADAAARTRLDGEVGAVLHYLGGHRERLGYVQRLRRGQVIGSGLVEGTIKQLVNLRVKRTGARWRADRVGAFVELLALADSAEWSEYWAALAA